ncbi:MAG: RecQ family ATP-dependent DNA helicase [Balneola sp.]|nr:MAG: RecQ family ATP-dependent DNA helicase [Balneola sp.]
MTDFFIKAKENLTRYWAYDAFREGQEEAIQSVLKGTDTLVLFPTGGGKSLCYQVPATVLEGLTLVVSPLVALMEDQVTQLSERGISSTYINSTLTSYEVEQRLVNARNGMYKLLYCAPERLGSPLFQAELERLSIQLVAIDEAHCISEWGHDFRPPYRKIRENLASIAEHTRWLALTATATPEVREDIISVLGFNEPSIISKGFERPNLKWWVTKTPQKRDRITEAVQKASAKGDGLMYAGTRKNCEDWALRFTKMEINSEAYHAGLTAELRKEIQHRWISGDTPLVTATNAFGMGIDKPDCRFVIHEEMPGSIEAYYQEAGRAGRDGEESFPILFFRESDYQKAIKRIEQSYPTYDQMQKVYVALGDSLNLALGSEVDEMVAFEMEKLSVRSSLAIPICRAAIRMMEQFGVVAVKRGIPPKASVQFSLSPDMMIKFKERCQNPEKAEFVDKLERMFGHFAHAHMVELDLEFVLEKLGVTRNALIKALNVLMMNDHVLMFALFPERDMIRLLEARSKEIPVTREMAESYRANLLKKLERMHGYILTQGCREVYLRTYFGELNAKPCGHCDNCLKKKEEHIQLDRDELRQLMDLINDQGLDIDKIVNRLEWAEDKVKTGVDYLVKEGLIN